MTHDVPKYFDSEEGKAFLRSLPREEMKKGERGGEEGKRVLGDEVCVCLFCEK